MKNRITKLCILTFLMVAFVLNGSLLGQAYWQKYCVNPVLSPGPEGSWDDQAVAHPNVLYDGSTYHLWYSGWSMDGNISIGYATSIDGIHWTKYDDPSTEDRQFSESDPVLLCGPSGSWDMESVHHPTIIHYGNTFFMWYLGRNMAPQHGALTCIGFAKSTDGIHWTKYNDPATVNPLLSESDPVMLQGNEGEWDQYLISWNNVVYTGFNFFMWYGGKASENTNLVEIGFATSHNGIHWTKYPDNPIVGPNEPWAQQFIVPTSVRLIDNTFHMWYGGSSGNDIFQTGYATSPYGVHWQKGPNNPVLPVGSLGEWDDRQAWGANVLYFEDLYRYKMWYHGTGYANDKYYIGYAETGVVGVEPVSAPIPTEFTLLQNYPNPFNPSTVIEFTLPEDALVNLAIYNTLGEKVASLASGQLPAGNYQYDWHAGDLPAGIYFYRLQAGEFNKVKKAVLLR